MSDSPCINICELDAAREYCIGCHRTLDEIALWSRLSPAARARVMTALPARAAGKTPPAGS